MQVFSLPYLPNIAWFQHLLASPNAVIDGFEHYNKQTYKNRCHILAANGVQTLIIPVTKNSGVKMPFNQLQANNSFNWQYQHWQSIQSAYGKSPYFFHYSHHFELFYQKPVTHIFEFNLNLVQLILKLLKIELPLNLSTAYVDAAIETDFRGFFNAKTNTPEELIFNKEYLQVFVEKFPFEPNLSILDLLFTQGPIGSNWLLKN